MTTPKRAAPRRAKPFPSTPEERRFWRSVQRRMKRDYDIWLAGMLDAIRRLIAEVERRKRRRPLRRKKPIPRIQKSRLSPSRS